MMENLRMINDMERVPSNGLTAESTQAAGKKVNSTESENSKDKTAV